MEYKTALVTGASTGLGKGLAAWLAARGVKVYAAARRAELLEALREETQGNVEPLVLDVSNSDETVTTLRKLDEECGGLDLVVANAGVGGDTTGRHIDWPTVERIIDVNVRGAAATLCAALPGMVARKRGHLVGVSSLAAFRGLPRSAAYCASKAFLATFLESIRLDVKKVGIKVTAIYPGFVKTDLTAKVKHPMPFLMDCADAVALMGEAIERQDSELAFPWQLAMAARTLKVVPQGLYGTLARRFL